MTKNGTAKPKLVTVAVTTAEKSIGDAKTAAGGFKPPGRWNLVSSATRQAAASPMRKCAVRSGAH